MKLELFKMDSCPYCRRVMAAIEGRTDVELCDINENEAFRQRLIAEGGKQQVPCLFIDGQPMYESADIIAWLNAHPQQ